MKKSRFPLLMTGWVAIFLLYGFLQISHAISVLIGANAVSKGPEKEKVIKVIFSQTPEFKMGFPSSTK